jgi:tetratricopeptide (TPR) repeat protein
MAPTVRLTARIARLVVVGAVMVFALIPRTSAAQSRSMARDRERVRAYLAIVEECRNRRVDVAVRGLSDLPEIDAAVAALKRLEPVIVSRAVAPGDIEWRDVDAAVLVHTATARVMAESARTDTAERHLHAAATLVEWRHDLDRVRTKWGAAPVDPGMNRRDWLLFTLGAFMQLRECDAVSFLADRAAEWYPKDAQVQLAAGAVDELCAGLEATKRQRQLLNQAATRFRAALRADPSVLEAGLRLAQILAAQRDFGNADYQFERVLAGNPDRRLTYLANLFMGAELERRYRPADAIARYRLAVAADANPQAARVALAFALQQAGRADEALRAIEPSLRPGQPRETLVDPFLLYRYGPPIDLNALALGLLKAVDR